jgi:hypothetical protein
MRELFPGYYRPTQEQFQKMWQECIFVFDANVLLNIYRYSPDTRDELFDVLEHLKDRIWIPHQAMLEYHENREEVISQQYAISKDIEIALTSASDTIDAKYKRGHPFTDTEIITDAIKEAIEKIKASIAQAESKYPSLLQNDYLLERLTNLFNDRIGKEYSTKRLEEIYKEFEQRFRLQIPPGYKDKNPKKEGFKKYGDGVLWFQVIDFAKSQKKTIILITDDQKDDWWRIEKGETLGPRPELAAEIGSKAKVSFYMYNSSQFLKYAKEFLGLKVKQEAIEEIKEVEINQRKYVGSSLARRGFQVENAVLEWIRRANPDVQLIENLFDSGVDFILPLPDGTKTGIQVKYKSSPFRPADVRRIIALLTDRRGTYYVPHDISLLLILVCENMEDAAQTLVKLREVTDIPPILTIKVGFMDGENSFRSFGTFLE